MLAVADFRARAAGRVEAMSRSGLRYQFGGKSWQAVLGGGKTILDDQVSSIIQPWFRSPSSHTF
jgi:hypothetical protein